MNFYTVYWLGGKFEFLYGNTIEDAFNKAGIGAGAVTQIDFYKNGFDFNYKYNTETRTWLNTGEAPQYVNVYTMEVSGVRVHRFNINGEVRQHLEDKGVSFNRFSDDEFIVKVQDLIPIWEMKLG